MRGHGVNVGGHCGLNDGPVVPPLNSKCLSEFQQDLGLVVRHVGLLGDGPEFFNIMHKFIGNGVVLLVALE